MSTTPKEVVRQANPSLQDKVLGCFWSHTIAVSVLLPFVLLFLYPRQVGFYFMLPYYTITLIFKRDEMRDGGRWPRFTKHAWFFRSMRAFVGLTIHPIPKELAEMEKQQNAQFIIAFFPHGCWGDFRLIMDGLLYDGVFPHVVGKVRVLAASVLFRMPLVREFALWTGCVDARRSVAEKLLDNGRTIMVMPGGEAEQLITEYGKEQVYLSKRKGFIKLALRKEVPVVPMYVFGCSDYYRTSNFLMGPRKWIMKNLQVCLPFAAGFLGSPICPLPVKTTVVFGKPLEFKIKEAGNPTRDELDQAHDDFVKALVLLFDGHKDRLGYGDRKLHVI